MANLEQLIILRQGTDIWNKWRQQNPNIEINLSYTNLTETNLAGTNLTRTNLTKTDLKKACIIGARL